MTLILRLEDEEEEFYFEHEVNHKKNPLLDQLETLADAIPQLIGNKKHLSDSEKRMLAHIRRKTRGFDGGKNGQNR